MSNEKDIQKFVEKEIKQFLDEQLFNIPGTRWGKRRNPYTSDARGGDIDQMRQEVEDADAASGLNKGQRQAYNAAVAASAEDTKKMVDALKDELTSNFRAQMSAAIEDAIDRIIDPEIDDMRKQFSDMFHLIIAELQREVEKAQQELNSRMENVAAQYLMKRDAPRVAKAVFKNQMGQN